MTEDAERIADIICGTDATDRGALLVQVAEILRDNAQDYTARLFELLGEMYDNGL
jgi:hypothetical protein